MIAFDTLREQFLRRLDSELPGKLTYHNSQHTQYVVNKAVEIAGKENVNGDQLELVKFAALYHDAGFLIKKEEHEALGCGIIREEFPGYGFNEDEIEAVCGMVMATRIPQTPHNLLEKIVADADLEYLGTDLFELGSDRLFREIRFDNPFFSPKEWIEVQIRFLSEHHYHTDFCKEYREPKKQLHILKLKEKLNSFS